MQILRLGRPSITKNQWYKDMLFGFFHHRNGFSHDGFEDLMEECVEEHVTEPVAEQGVLMQGAPMEGQDGLVGGNFRIVFWVSLFALVWYIML